MIRKNFYVLGGKRYVGNSQGAMMSLRHNLVIGQFILMAAEEAVFGSCEQERSAARCG